jgi:hypothetical protein
MAEAMVDDMLEGSRPPSAKCCASRWSGVRLNLSGRALEPAVSHG